MNQFNKGVPLSAIPPIPEQAEMLIAENWSGLVWSHDETRSYHLLWREQGASGGNYIVFVNWQHLQETLDIMGGLYGFEDIGNDMPEPSDDHSGSFRTLG